MIRVARGKVTRHRKGGDIRLQMGGMGPQTIAIKGGLLRAIIAMPACDKTNRIRAKRFGKVSPLQRALIKTNQDEANTAAHPFHHGICRQGG